MPKAKFKKLHKNVCVAFARLTERGGMLCRQSSQTDEAMAMGGGFIYFDARGGGDLFPQPQPCFSSRTSSSSR